MKADSTIYRIALAVVARNLSLGIFAVMFFAMLMPSISLKEMLIPCFCLVTSFSAGIIFAYGAGEYSMDQRFGFIRLVSALLLGSSLMAIVWKSQELPHALEIIVLSFSIRWLLYIIESVNLRRADMQHQPLPSQATRIRRWITFVTGALIPGLILMGVANIPLLILSFSLTAFSQWAIACEGIYQRRLQISG